MSLTVFASQGTTTAPRQWGVEDMNMANVKTVKLTFEELDEAIAYGPDLGTFIWKIAPGKSIKAGASAGCFKGVRTDKRGVASRYMYIRLNGYEVPAGRVAWMLTHKVWPEGTIRFADGDTANFRLSNLMEARFARTVIHENGVKRSVMSKEAQRHYSLKRYYGMDLARYDEMLLSQEGVCNICEKPEATMLHGKLRPLSVDHDHETGAIRGLLCNACNHILGEAKDSATVLRSAADYLDKHSGATPNVVKFSEEKA